ncbi:hypothetical protein DGMP_27750 [Desulfomarina profundi]|uniref:Transmembrane protein n=1 Tax=Desulfomarina profundi TaxID=2772557 RepID=A0A8D5FI71_9BACT|nr:TIGR02186 family protein [Desulfomarina profundi]BCL62082.1 hypothetical protein DGMP_27750 [Desulfomarina profundi]
MRTYSFKLILLLILAALPLTQLSAMADENITISVSPSPLLIGAQYNGADLTVKGTIPAGSDVVIRFTGEPEELHLREKGKAFNLLWMNVGTVTFDNVPKVLLIETSRPFEELGPEAKTLQLDSLHNTVEVTKPASSEDIDLVHELLLLKKEESLYSEKIGGIVLGPDSGPTRTFTATLKLPSALAPGEYQVEATAFRDGKLVADSRVDMEARLDGFPLWLSNMAFNNSLLYGILAVVIAIFSGLVIGLIFQSKGAH